MFASAMTDIDVIAALTRLDAIGPKTVRAIMENSSTIDEAIDLASVHATADTRHPYLNKKAVRSLANRDAVVRLIDSSRSDREIFERQGGVVLDLNDPRYPRRLRSVEDAPPVLNVLGNYPADKAIVACAGTRDPNVFGAAVSRKLTAVLASEGYSIATGAALGIDDLCQSAAFEAGARVVAVVSHGIPAEGVNRRRVDRIVERGGCVVSEFSAATETTPSTLMTRNRTVTGIAIALFAMQGSATTSGTRKAVSDAYKQGTAVFIPVPPPAHEDAARDALITFAREHELSRHLMLVRSREDYPAMLQRLRDLAASDQL